MTLHDLLLAYVLLVALPGVPVWLMVREARRPMTPNTRGNDDG